MPLPYQGGKQREAFEIARRILDLEGDRRLPYFEPFAGMLSVGLCLLQQSPRPARALDLNPDVTAFWQAVKDGWLPPVDVTKEDYCRLRDDKVPSAERLFAGVAASYYGKLFGGYKWKDGQEVARRNCLANYRRKIAAVAALVPEVDNGCYQDEDPIGMLIYADPPYAGNNFHGRTREFFQFDSDLFWATMQRWSDSNIVIVSEQMAPDGWVVMWERPVVKFGGRLFIEKLFVHIDSCIFDL